MKHTYMNMLVAAALVCGFTACDKSDDAEGWNFDYAAPTFSNDEVGQKQKSIYDTYNMAVMTEFDDVFAVYDWTESNWQDKYHFSVTKVKSDDKAQTAAYLQELQQVLEKLPAAITKHMPSHVLLVDSLINSYTYNNDSTSRTMMGYSVSNYPVFAYGGKSHDSQSIDELRITWTELLVEKALAYYTLPDTLTNYVGKMKSGSYEGYQLTGLTSKSIDMKDYGFFHDAFVRVTPIMSSTYTKRKGLTETYWTKMDTKQDLALYIAHIMWMDPETLAGIYANNAEAYGEKERIVSEFCKNQLGFELKSLR